MREFMGGNLKILEVFFGWKLTFAGKQQNNFGIWKFHFWSKVAGKEQFENIENYLCREVMLKFLQS